MTLDELDALVIIRDRFFGLHAAIRGARMASDHDRAGLLQLAEDMGQALEEVYWAAQESLARSKKQPTQRRRKFR